LSAPLVRARISGEWLDLGTVPPTIIPAANLTARKITADSAGGAAKGTESPDFKATLAGYLSNLGGQQDRLGLGKFGIKFVPSNYDPAKGLDPSQENYPFARVDGQALSPAEKTKFTSQITNGYFNAFEAIKGGANLLDINKAFSESFFRPERGAAWFTPRACGASAQSVCS
jgi:hypothetical protein